MLDSHISNQKLISAPRKFDAFVILIEDEECFHCRKYIRIHMFVLYFVLFNAVIRTDVASFPI